MITRLKRLGAALWPSFVLPLATAMDVIDRTGAPVTGGQLERLADLQAEWAQRQQDLQNISSSHLAPINRWARDQGVPHLSVPGE
jgi:hypothetical protein